MAERKAVTSKRTSKRADKSSPASTPNFLDRLPSEILIKILSYLDAPALFTISHVNKHFHRLANDNALWSKIYTTELAKDKKQKPKRMDELQQKMAIVEVRDRPAGYWKWQHFKTVATHEVDKWKNLLGVISSYSGLPCHTERVLRNFRVTWELTVSDKSGREGTHEPSRSQFWETSLTLCWSRECLPDFQQISTLHLHGVRKIALGWPGRVKPSWRSLMAKLDMQTLAESARVIGRDKLVELRLLQPGVVVGVWRDQDAVAFVMFTLHLHRLVERSTQGSSVCPIVEPIIKPPFDDIDPEYGLHGYQLHIVLHDTACEILSGCFPKLFCQRTQISDGLIPLTAISRTTSSQHRPLSGSVTLPWRCGAIPGAVKNCCIMSLTLMDEFMKPFWCVASPVSMEPERTPVSYDYDYDGEHFLIRYRDSDGQVEMSLVWMEEQKQFFLISLVIYVTVGKVNQHFGRDY